MVSLVDIDLGECRKSFAGSVDEKTWREAKSLKMMKVIGLKSHNLNKIYD